MRPDCDSPVARRIICGSGHVGGLRDVGGRHRILCQIVRSLETTVSLWLGWCVWVTYPNSGLVEHPIMPVDRMWPHRRLAGFGPPSNQDLSVARPRLARWMEGFASGLPIQRILWYVG